MRSISTEELLVVVEMTELMTQISKTPRKIIKPVNDKHGQYACTLSKGTAS